MKKEEPEAPRAQTGECSLPGQHDHDHSGDFSDRAEKRAAKK